MGKPFSVMRNRGRVSMVQTEGSETSQYLEEKKPITISRSLCSQLCIVTGILNSLSSGERKGNSPNLLWTLDARD